MTSRELTLPEKRRLDRSVTKVHAAEGALVDAREALLAEITNFLNDGYSQSAVARALGITRATLNQKVRSPRVRRSRGGSKASKPKQGKHR